MTDLGAPLRITVFLLYCLAGVVWFRWLMPHLNSNARRISAFMLLAQIAFVGLAFSNPPFSGFDRWLWNLDVEGNLFSIFATTQLALAGGFALCAGRVALSRPAWQRLYFAGIGILFLLLAWDEFYDLRGLANWHRMYTALGIIVVTVSVFVAFRSPRITRRWFMCFLIGLAIGAAGAIFVDSVPWNCDTLGGWRIVIDGCLDFYRVEEMLEALGVWLTLVGMSGLYSDLRAEGRLRALPRAMYLLPPLIALVFMRPMMLEFFEYRFAAQPAIVHVESNISIEAFRLEIDTDVLATALFLSSRNWHRFTGVGVSIHVVDQVSGLSVAHIDDHVSRRHAWRQSLFDPTVRYIQRNEVNIPPDTPSNRALWILLTLWREENGDYVRQKIHSSDLQRLSDTQLILDEFVLKASTPLPETNTALASFENGFALESVGMPEQATAGDTLNITFTWRADEAEHLEYTQFLHLGHKESGKWLVHDQQPLGDRLPTTLWYNGLSDSETWQVPLPADMRAGGYAIFTGLYDVQDGERLIVRDVNGEPFLDARVPLGSLIIQAS